MYASDYSRWDCGFPETARTMARRGDLDDAAKRQIMSETARASYRL